MSRVYGDPIQVWTRDGRPVSFVWRGRLYTVRKIIDHWVLTREWWKTSDTDPGERVFWKVEATGNNAAGQAGVYELRYDTASDGWLMQRVWD